MVYQKNLVHISFLLLAVSFLCYKTGFENNITPLNKNVIPYWA